MALGDGRLGGDRRMGVMQGAPCKLWLDAVYVCKVVHKHSDLGFLVGF